MQRAVAEAEHAALADAEDVDLVDAVTLANDVDAAIDVTVDVIVQGQVLVGAVRVTPVDQVDVLAGIEQALDRGAVFLDVGHVGPVDQGVDDQRRDLVLHHAGGGLVAVKLELVFAIDFLARRHAGGDLLGVEQVLDALAQVLVELNQFFDHAIGTERNVAHRIRLLLWFGLLWPF